MFTRIGIVAGKILTLLEEEGDSPLSIKELELYLDEPGDVILMSVGWLIRERLIQVAPNNLGDQTRENFFVWLPTKEALHGSIAGNGCRGMSR